MCESALPQGSRPRTTCNAARRAAAVLALLLSAGPLLAQLETIETDDLRLVYFSPTLTFMAPYAAQCLENSLQFQKDVLGFDPAEKVTVLLKDFSDRGNAGAGAIPRDHLQFDVAPLDFSFESIVAGERMYMLTNHELVHVATMDRAAHSDRVFRTLFQGKVNPHSDNPESILYLYLTNPRVASPRWYLEGIAVFAETWMAGGLGRAQGAYDEMVFRSMVRDDSHFYDPLGLVSEGTKIDFQVEVNAYLYGTRFMSYLAYRYSPEKLVDWVGRADGSKAYYAAQFEHVYGMPLRQAWQDWIDFEHGFQQENLERIRAYPTTPYRDISDRPLGSVSRPQLDAAGHKLYAAFNEPGVVANIGSISLDDGSVERLIDVKAPAIYSVSSLAFEPQSQTVFYTTDHFAFRDLRALDLSTRKSHILIKDARVGDLTLDPVSRSLWAVRHLNGITTLVEIAPPYREWKRVRSWPFGEVIYNLAVSPDGTLLSASVGEISGHHLLRVFRVADLRDEGIETPKPVAELELGTSIPLNFTFSPDGRYLYGSSYYTGVSNVFRFEVASQKLEALSNTETGFFFPIPLEDGSVIVLRYTGAGFVPAMLEHPQPIEDVNPIEFFGQKIIEKYPELKDWRVGSPASVDLAARTEREGHYGSFRSVGLESLYPVVEGYKDSAAVGLRFNFSDPVGLNNFSAVATYSPDHDLASDERLHLALGFERHNFHASAKLNNADFYDLFGPTKKSLKGYSLGMGWNKLLLYDKPRQMELNIDGTFYGDLERLPDFQNVPVGFSELFTMRARLHYENMRSSLGHVDDEKGLTWEVVANNDYVDDDSIPSLRAGIDVGFALPLRHSSIWLRNSAGRAFGDLEDPFSNFFFGGFGNNYVDHASIKRYHQFYAFPGLEINEVGGRSFAKSVVEWNLPPIRFRRAGWPGFYVTWARPSLFVAGLVTNPEEDDTLRQELWDAGAQLDFRIAMLSNLEMTFSVGYAVAFESGLDSRDEVMFSLKILSD